MIYFTSDLHLDHKNMAEGQTTWKKGFRSFSNIESMNATIIHNINNMVNSDDVLYILGDFAFSNNPQRINRLLERINCNNIHLILGNHDKIFKKQGKISGKILSMQDYCEIYIDKQLLILCHYSIRSWRGMHRNSFHLYGHSHASLEYSPIGKSMDVGIDNAYRLFKEYRPFSYEEIEKILNKRTIEVLDHHEE